MLSRVMWLFFFSLLSCLSLFSMIGIEVGLMLLCLLKMVMIFFGLMLKFLMNVVVCGWLIWWMMNWFSLFIV